MTFPEMRTRNKEIYTPVCLKKLPPKETAGGNDQGYKPCLHILTTLGHERCLKSKRYRAAKKKAQRNPKWRRIGVQSAEHDSEEKEKKRNEKGEESWKGFEE